VQTLSQLQLDFVFMGVHGMSVKGSTTPNIAEAETNRAFAATTSDVVVLANHSKWNLNGLCTIMPCPDAAMVITGSSLRHDVPSVLKREFRNLRIIDAQIDSTDLDAELNPPYSSWR